MGSSTQSQSKIILKEKEFLSYSNARPETPKENLGRASHSSPAILLECQPKAHAVPNTSVALSQEPEMPLSSDTNSPVAYNPPMESTWRCKGKEKENRGLSVGPTGGCAKIKVTGEVRAEQFVSFFQGNCPNTVALQHHQYRLCADNLLANESRFLLKQ